MRAQVVLALVTVASTVAAAPARMGTDLVTDGYARAVAFSPDGSRLYTASWSQVIAWDARTMRPLAVLGPCSDATAVEVFGDGKRLMVADATSLRVLDVMKGGEVWKLPLEHHAQAGSARLSPDDKTIALPKKIADQPAVLVDAATGTLRQSLDLTATAVAFSPDGRRLALVGDRSKVVIVDVASGSEVSSFDTKQTSLEAIAWVGSTIAVGGVGGEVVTWSVSGHKQRQFSGSGWVVALAFSRDGKRLAGLQQGSGARVWDVATGKVVFEHDANTQGSQVAFSPDGRRFAWSDEGQEARRHEPRSVELATGALSPSLERHDGVVMALAFTADDQRLISGSDDATARIWNVADGAALARMPSAASDGATSNVAMVALAPDGTIATGSRDSTIRLWSSDGKHLVRSFKLVADPSKAPWIPALAFTPDGRQLVILPASGDLEVRAPATGELVRKLAVGSTADRKGLAVSADGRTVFATIGQSVIAWELATGKRTLTVADAVSGFLARIAVSPDGKTIATPVDAGLALRGLDGKVVKTIASEEPIHAFAWSPDGKDIAVASESKTRIVTVATGRERALPIDNVWSIAYSHDGKLVATGARDGVLLVWPAGVTK